MSTPAHDIPDLNDAEQRVAEDIVSVVDFVSRVINAPAGSHYQWEKLWQLANAATRAHRTLSAVDDDGTLTWSRPDEPVDTEKVMAYVAHEARHYDVGRRLWPAPSNGDT